VTDNINFYDTDCAPTERYCFYSLIITQMALLRSVIASNLILQHSHDSTTNTNTLILY